MKISEFVIGRNVEKQAVYRYINRHEELLSQCTKDGKELEMPMEVVAELEKQYPLPKPTYIINGVPEEEHRAVLERLTKAQEAMLLMQNELTEHKLLQADYEAQKMLLEDRQKRAEEDAQKAQEKVAELTAELEQEKAKTWWQKLRGK